jgi:aldehyde dehydrogenase (NAD+)
MPSDPIRALGLSDDPRFVAPSKLGAKAAGVHDGMVVTENPATGEALGGVRLDDTAALSRAIAESVEAFRKWREVPAPARGQVVRAIGDEFRRVKEPLGELVSLEMGKIRAEGLGEVQETIDIADFAVGLSRQLPGQVFPSERAGHRMFEQWLPLGPVGVITAFNFPNAVWGWNAMLAAVCGDTTVWKPSLLTPLVAMATNAVAERVAAKMGHAGVFKLIIGTDDVVGRPMVADRRLPLISATGSCRMGRAVGQAVAARLGRSLLELGGNNAVIVHADADQELALRSTVFGAVGTAGQRCTTTRRLLLHESIAEKFTQRLVAAYAQVAARIGDPLKEGTLIGPLASAAAVEQFLAAVKAAKEQGGEVLFGGERASPAGLRGHFVQPTVVRAPKSNRLPIALEETFAPILYVFTYRDLDEAMAMHNGVDQGLSSAIFTESIRVSERFLSPTGSGSDCGIANVNAGTSGAEIGGAFGGEKDTGGGRESGSDSWKAYMRRQTTTINFGGKFELAQGIRFE